MPNYCRPLSTHFLLGLILCSLTISKAQAAEPVKILLITGGCCHDYDYQTKEMQAAFKEHKVEVEWKVVNEGGNGTKAEIDMYNNPAWAKGYDVVIHNECFADTTSDEYIRKITKAHKDGANAVVIHCAMHTYRAGKIDDWREMLQKEDLEAVQIATPLWTHAEITVGCLNAGKHVLCEKMMAKSEAECQSMIDAAHKNNRVLEIGYQRYYNPIYQAAYNNIIKQGVLGDVYHARLAWHRSGSGRCRKRHNRIARGLCRRCP